MLGEFSNYSFYVSRVISLRLKMANLWFPCSNFSFTWPNILKYLNNDFDHKTQDKFYFGCNILYKTRVITLDFFVCSTMHIAISLIFISNMGFYVFIYFILNYSKKIQLNVECNLNHFKKQRSSML